MSLISAIRQSGRFFRVLTSQTFIRSSYSSESPVLNNPLVDKNDMPVEMENPFVKEKPKCILCKMNITPHFKNTKLLSQFVSPFTGRIYGRHITRLCKKKQEHVEREIVKAQNSGFMPYMHKDPKFMKDPKLFNPQRPMRNHDYC